ncbi:MAG: hypothetical protein ACT4QG_20700 [Sporichthyaceae bacterium]
MMRRALLASLAVAVLLAGCGGGEDAPVSTVAEGSTPAASTVPSPTVSAPGINPSATLKSNAPTAGPLRVVYTDTTGLWVAALGGGAPKRLATHGEFSGVSVSPDGKTAAYAAVDEGVFLVDLDGGRPRLLDKDGLGDPVFSPDGTTVAMIHRDGDGLNIFSVNVDGTGSTKLSSGSEYFARYFSDRDLLVGSPTSMDRLPAAGGAAKKLVSIADRFQRIHTIELSSNGKRIAYAFEAEGSLELTTDVYVVDSDGKNRKRLTTTKDAFCPTWSPDDGSIVFSRGCDGTNCPNLGIWAMRADGTKLRGLAKFGTMPRFSLDGRYVAFSSKNGVGVVRPDGTGAKTVGRGAVDYFAFVPAAG